MSNKTQWREDADRRIAGAKTPSQALRFALFEEFQQKGLQEGMTFEQYYSDQMRDIIQETLDQAENIHIEKESAG